MTSKKKIATGIRTKQKDIKWVSQEEEAEEKIHNWTRDTEEEEEEQEERDEGEVEEEEEQKQGKE